MKFPFNFSLPLKSLFSRFPITVVLIAALATTVYISMAVLDYSEADNYNRYIFAIISAGLFVGIMATVAIQYASERFSYSSLIKYIAQAVSLAVIALFVYLFMALDIREFDVLDGMLSSGSIRLVALVGISILAVFALPFVGTKDSTQWWNFVQTTIFRLAVSYFYALAIFLGLALALFAIESFWDFQLLGEDQYALISTFAFILFAPYYFLAELHKFNSSLETEKLNKYLSFFLKFILTPLIFIYLFILYPYIMQFPFQEKWPSNELTIITTVLMGMNALGFILLYGQEELSFTLFRRFKLSLHNLYYTYITLLSLPTLFFLMYSLYLRINAYDWTVNRFGLLALILWAIGVLLYFLLSKTRNAAYVVTALILVIVSVYILPFTYVISKSAQESRLIELMEDRLTKEGKGYDQAETLSYEQDEEMKDIVEYLTTYHNLGVIRPLLSDKIIDQDLYAESDRIISYNTYQIDFAHVIEGGWQDPSEAGKKYYSLVYAKPGVDFSMLPSDLSTAVWYQSYNRMNFDSKEVSFEVDGDKFEYTLPEESKDIKNELCTIDLGNAYNSDKYYRNEYPYFIDDYAICGLDQSDFIAKSDSGSVFVIKGLEGFFIDESFELTNLSGYYIHKAK